MPQSKGKKTIVLKSIKEENYSEFDEKTLDAKTFTDLLVKKFRKFLRLKVNERRYQRKLVVALASVIKKKGTIMILMRTRL